MEQYISLVHSSHLITSCSSVGDALVGVVAVVDVATVEN